MDETGVDIELLTRVAEALIFATDEPLNAATVADIFADIVGDERVDSEHVEAAVDRLNERLEENQSAIRVERWAGGYRMATIADFAPFVKALLTAENERRMSRSLMETLAVVAYKQPVTKPEIDHVRGVNADYAIRKLLEAHLVAVVGRDDSVGRPLLYGTSDHFLDQFGLVSLEELPKPREIEELLSDPAFTRERAELLASIDDGQQVLFAPENGKEEDGPQKTE